MPPLSMPFAWPSSSSGQRRWLWIFGSAIGEPQMISVFASLLEKTLIIWGSPMADPNIHNHRRCPLLLLGHANGMLKGGIHLKAEDGTPMANVMLALLQRL